MNHLKIDFLFPHDKFLKCTMKLCKPKNVDESPVFSALDSGCCHIEQLNFHVMISHLVPSSWNQTPTTCLWRHSFPTPVANCRI